METTKNISEAKKTGKKFHVISSNEVHSFDNLKDAQKDWQDAKEAEIKINSGFVPLLIGDKTMKAIKKYHVHIEANTNSESLANFKSKKDAIKYAKSVRRSEYNYSEAENPEIVVFCNDKRVYSETF